MDSGKILMNNDKSLCLYCDKTFANLNDQENHVERDHKTISKSSRGKGSRKSERIIKISTIDPFPGCFFCNNRKLTGRSDDLESLFQHLMTVHNDVYYGCKCRVRMQDKVALVNHKKKCKIGINDIDNDVDVDSNDKNNVKNEEEELVLPEKINNNKKGKTKKCDNNPQSEHSQQQQQQHHHRTNAINKKSENNSSNSSRKNNVKKKNNNSRKVPSSNNSTISSDSKASDDYSIPITRQKLKEPTSTAAAVNKQQNRTTSNKKSSKVASSSSSSSSSSSFTTTNSFFNSSVESKNSHANASLSTSSSSSSSLAKVQRTKASKVTLNSQVTTNNPNGELNENIIPPFGINSNSTLVKNEIASCEFDEDFYKNISGNIRLNLNCFIDGKEDRLQNKKFIIENGSDESTTNTKAASTSVTTANNDNEHQKEIHEATNFELSNPPFPALLTAEQYGFGDSNPNKNKRQFTKNSWKWRWDLIKKYKYVNEGGKIVKKVKQITTGLKDLSQLDMWTQLSMRSRYESLNIQQHGFNNDGLNDNLSMRMIKTQNIEQLNGILDKRLTPEIHIEQLHQMLVKEELVEGDEIVDNFTPETQTDDNCNDQKTGIFNMLQLTNINNKNAFNPASLSGEWARPRCFVCIDCGQEFDLMKSLNDHKNSEHPYVVSAHYEVVGRENLEHKLYKNLFLPKKALNTIGSAKSISINSDSKSNETSSSSQDTNSHFADMREKECTKCQKMIKYSNDIDIYRHILDCIEDKVWMQAKRRNKYRRSRRKGKKNSRKLPPRVSNDQKKSTSSPLMNDNVEGICNVLESLLHKNLFLILGENSVLSISNPPTPKEEKITSSPSSTMVQVISNNSKTKNENFINNDEGMNIKSFFRVSKTTPNLPQRMVVQMLQMPNPSHNNNSNNNSLRHLRSSAKKQQDDTNKKSPQKSTNESNEGDTKKNETINKIIEIKIENENTNSQIDKSLPSPESSMILSTLHISTPDKCKTPLNSPTNSTNSSLVSPTSCSSVPKKKKKLNDCIAMLTCKIQEKLGVNFFDSSVPSNEKSSLSPSSSNQCKQPQPLENNPPVTMPSSSIPLLSITPSTLITNVPQSPSLTLTPPLQLPPLPQIQYNCPIQDEVIDLSIKKSVTLPETEEEKSKRDPSEEIEQRSHEIVDDKKETLEGKVEEIFQHESKQEEIEVESFKISIAREKIPDLDEIIEKQNVITVNKLKISESERKAFEEQKNRIMQILSKKVTPKKATTPSKKTAKKVPSKKALKQPKKQNAKKTIKILRNDEKLVEKDEENFEILKEKQNEVVEKKNTNELNAELPTANEGEKKEDIFNQKVQPVKKAMAKGKKKTPKNQKAKNENQLENMKAVIVLEKIDEIKELPLENIQKPEEKLLEIEKVPFPSVNEEIPSPITEEKTPMLSEEKISPPAVIEKQPEKEEKVAFPSATSSDEKKDEIIGSKIQKAIKNTNRIRCRRLSVVVDPIIHLPAFQNNRKIRLTNNSQQNGFYDLLANDQLLNALKNAPQLKKEIKKLEAKKTTISQAIKEVKAVVNKETSSAKPKKPKKKTSRYANGKVMKVTRKKKKSAAKIIQVENKANQVQVSSEKALPVSEKKSLNDTKENELILSPPPPAPTQQEKVITPQKGKKKVTIVEDVQLTTLKLQEKTPLKTAKITPKKTTLEPTNIVPQKSQKEIPITPEVPPLTPTKTNKAIQKKTPLNKKLSRKNEIDSLPTPTSPKKAPITRKTRNVTKENLVISKESENIDEKVSLDVSLSSDTSNENDIPLAKLITPKNSEVQQNIEEISESEARNKSVEIKSKDVNEESETKTSFKNIFSQQQKVENQAKITKDELKSHTIQKQPIYKPKDVKGVTNKRENSKKSDPADKFQVFEINDDSFFNDDNEVDQANDKINALVNNIINSSELIDSENEKIDGGKNQETKCEICNKTFRNEKVLDKHFKTNTHLLKEKRKEKKNEKDTKITQTQPQQKQQVVDETKIFRTKGALKTFDNIPSVTLKNEEKSNDEFKPIIEDSTSFVPIKINENAEDDDDDDEDLSTKDKIFDSLFSNIENKLQAAAKNEPLPKFNFPKLSHHDSESSSTSWDLKHDADLDWNTNAIGNNEVEKEPQMPAYSAINSIKNLPTNASTPPLKAKAIKPKETAVSIPTKSLIMGKIFKKHRDREKQKTPQADAPNNKPEIKNSLDEIFDHLKNSAEIDDKVLTCPSPKTLLKNSGGTFSPHSTNSDMLETASQSNNNNIYKVTPNISLSEKSRITTEKSRASKQKKKDVIVDDEDEEEETDGIGKRKSRRRCAIKAKTFAETWSSDEYEELHDTNDIISIINEIEKREESIKKRKEVNLLNDSEESILKTSDNNKKKVQLQFPSLENDKSTIKKRRMSTLKDGHKSDDETIKDQKTPQQKNQMSIKKRRMSCFVPSTIALKSSENSTVKAKPIQQNSGFELKPVSNISSGSGSNKNILKNCINTNTSNTHQLSTITSDKNLKKKNQKHRKRPRNKVKNIAYDSDSDFELNLSKKSKSLALNNTSTTTASTLYNHSDSDSQDEDDDYDNDFDDDIESSKTSQMNNSVTHKSELLTMTKEPTKLLPPNDLNAVANSQHTAIAKAAIQQHQQHLSQQKHNNEDIKNSIDNACNRTKRHSSEKLYYWSSSSDSEIEHGDIADSGENEDSMIPQQPEQHGWIVGDSHKKLVTLLAHAKIKNKIN